MSSKQNAASEETNQELTVKKGLCFKHRDSSLTVLEPVPNKPKTWFVLVTVMGFTFHRRKPLRPVEMIEDEIIEMYLRHIGAEAARGMKKTGLNPNANRRKFRDTGLFKRKIPVAVPNELRQNRKTSIHEALQRLKAQASGQAA